MPNLGETSDAGLSDAAELARLGIGFGTLVGGAAIYAPTVLRAVDDGALALGVPAPTATRLGLTLALLSPPLVLALLRTRLPAAVGGLPVTAGGVLVCLAVLGLWATPMGAAVGELALPVLLAYAAGLVLLSVGVLAGPVAALAEAGGSASASGSVGAGPSVSFQRSTNSSGRGAAFADGGREAGAALEFPLDDE